MTKPDCPACGSPDVAVLVFGYPSWETEEAVERGEARLPGRAGGDASPEWHCNACHHEW